MKLYIGKDDVSLLASSKINKELDRLERYSSELTDALIDEGRGNERFSETMAKSDKLALAFRAVHNRLHELRAEVARRYGPGAPARLPRGFDPT